MLNHKTIGPTDNGQYLVVYQTPGCDVPTVTTICRTQQQADAEADKLNAIQSEREQGIWSYRELRSAYTGINS